MNPMNIGSVLSTCRTIVTESKGSMEGVVFQSGFTQWHDGTQFLPASQESLKALQAQPGNIIAVSLAVRI